MEKAPAFQFYPSDFLTDENVVMMSNREVGCYIKLLCYCWREESIPSDIKRIAKLCGESESAMAELWPGIEPCFQNTGNGRLYHGRLQKERQKQAAHSKERSEAGKRGAEKRWKNQRKLESEKQNDNKDLNSSPIAEPIAEPMAEPIAEPMAEPIAEPMAEPIANDGSSSSSSSSSSFLEDTNVSSEGAKAPSRLKCPHQKIVKLYHEILPELPAVKSWPEDLQKILRKFWKEHPSLDWFRDYFNYVKDSDFLMGRKTDFQADLEWLIRPKNRTKVQNGRYHRDSNSKHAGLLRWLEIRRERDGE